MASATASIFTVPPKMITPPEANPVLSANPAWTQGSLVDADLAIRLPVMDISPHRQHMACAFLPSTSTSPFNVIASNAYSVPTDVMLPPVFSMSLPPDTTA